MEQTEIDDESSFDIGIDAVSDHLGVDSYLLRQDPETHPGIGEEMFDDALIDIIKNDRGDLPGHRIRTISEFIDGVLATRRDRGLQSDRRNDVGETLIGGFVFGDGDVTDIQELFDSLDGIVQFSSRSCDSD